MSEVTDLDANNLCTTEDAFESFQAVSMYQEDEYITLSDLVSPEPVAPDLTSEINEIPYDNEVVLNSNAEVLGEVSTTLDPVIEETIQATVEPSDLSTVSKVNIENPVDTSNENCLNSNEKPLNGKQRGRKKKILYGGTSELGSNFSGSFDTFLKITKSGARENSIPKPNLIVDSDRNRSKRIKSDSLLEENSAVRDEKAPVKHVVSKFGRTIKLKTNIDSTQDFDYETKKVSKRRGRQKKEAVDIQPPHDVDPTNLSNSLVSSEVSQSENDGIDDLPLGTPRVKRRGRPKKDLRNDQSHDVTFGTLGDEDKKQDCSRKYLGNDEIDDIPLGTLSHGAKEQSGTRKDTGNGENDDTSLIILNDGVKRRHRTRKDSGTDEMSLSSLSHRVKKRGRPRKESVTDDIALSTLSDEVNKGSRSKQDSDSDEIDEISLSMLGKRVKKQGKARKEITSLNKFANNPATSSVVKNLETDVNDDITLNNLNVKAKRGRKKRISSVTSSLLEKSSIGNTTEDFINKDEEDFNNTNITLSGVLENQIDNTNEQLNDNILTEIKKSPGKRGRKPKKQFIDAPSEDAEVKISPNEENNEDITDDVCLSQLKKCETNKTSTETDDIDIKVDTNKTNNETNDIDIKVDTNKTSNETNDIGITVDTNKTSNETDDIGIKIDTDKPQSTSLDVDSMDLKCGDITNKRHSKMPKMSDFEYNLDSIVVKDGETLNDSQDDDINNLLIEDPSKRPTRRKVKTALHYDEGSDEDPFANVELSDDDEPRRRKGTKYYSDDEYIPDAKIDKLGFGIAAEESSDSDIDESLDELIMQRKRRSPKKGNSQGPSKRIKKADITTDTPKADTSADGDIEGSLQSSVIKSTDSAESEPLRNWGMSNEFENFIAKKIQGTNLKIKKVSSTASTESSLAPLKIPTINTNEQKKTIEMCTQTKSIYSESVAVQTSVPCDMPMKENLPLTPEQSEKACEFLNSIVKTTAELGQLMTEKSEDFIKKKINTTHVVDTFKMDYCVKKSFLLFKLAKHNLMQMEEDLSKQYDEFLKSNDLLACREQIKEVKPKPPTDSKATSDSDCEIVGESTPGPAPKKRQEKPKFNPKTVFLNKELSIKIAKKPTDDKKLNIKGRHTVWINDSVMVKKVKPTQSFLAQDSRNKKPPDNFILAKMVSDFFRNYNREKIVSMCAPFTSAEWLHVSRNYVCNYFVVTPSELTGDTNYQQNNSHYVNDTTENNNIISQPNCSHIFSKGNINNMRTPKSLISLCTHALQNHLKMVNFDVKEARYDDSNQLTDEKNSKIKPVTLFRLCVGVLNEGEMDTIKVFPSIESPPNILKVMSLKTLCYRRTIELFYMNSLISDSSKRVNDTIYYNKGINLKVNEQHDHTSSVMYANQSKIKSLFTICVEFLQKEQEIDTRCINIEDHIIQKTLYTASSLKHIAFVNIRNKLYKNEAMTAKSIGEHSTDMPKPASNAKIDINAKESSVTVEGLTINCINTLSEEAFQNLDESVLNIQDNSQYLDDNSNYDEEFDTDYNNFEDDQTEGDNWVSQVQMQELRSCFTPNNEPPSHENNIFDEEPAGSPDIARVKIEPLDEMPDTMVDATVIKTEPENNLDEMTIIPDSIITKSEILDQPANAKVIERQNSNSYDVDSFESFVSSNKMMRSLSENGDEIFSQSGLRVRRQHEPDYAQEYDAGMSLLIPQTYATLNIENAKGDLMESSSDDATCDPKLKGKKKLDKRRGKQKKTEPKSKPKEVVTKTKDKLAVDTEVAVLTRRMREKIRQEEKMVESSDSEDENMTLNLRKEKDKKENTDKSKPSKSTKKSEDEIQCSNVDSTEQVNDNTNNSNTPVEKDKFTGFSAIDQNEISSYQKYMKYVYDKIIPKEDEKKENNERAVPIENNMEFNNERSQSPLIDFTEPAELLECEPTMPIFDDVAVRPKGKKKDIGDKNKEKQSSNIANDNEKQYTERHGWKCYHMDGNDPKLYQNAYIPLEKLPEDFVDTYLMYQDITDRDKEDEEVNRLINLNSLNRANIKDLATRSRNKIKNTDGEPSAHGSESNSRAASPAYSDHYAELTPSEDEGANVDDELPPAPRRQTAENSLAKNLLMNDNESDSDSSPKKIKEEITDENNTSKVYKPGPKSKRKHAETEAKDSDNLMLTADKMMNKELTLLHAPIVLKTEVPETPAKGPSTRHKQKSATKTPPTRDNTKADNSEESEEEKREKWVNTKEKLLKRVQRKEDASIEDAKRAKLVSEFIERRGDAPELQNRNRGRGRRSRKKFLERQKQLGVLSKELYGETSDSIGVSGKRSTAAAVFKGRRNIRKVIDKKSLARSTVLANMEEFERKRRLSMRQSRLTELLGCEEGVNVLVINDEVCLEYDFDENRAIVTVHPFFTKVMKAHQYEGVKFMWDACFESVSSIEAGLPGGGCILAHCMGLGKTLQVLALLHTVLTHPRAAMQRVLVCCPLSTVLNWVDEIHQWIGPVTDQIKVFELSKLKKTYERAYQLEDWYNGGGIFIIGYELFRSLTTLDPVLDDIRPTVVNKIRRALLDPGPDIIVCDEGHLLKNDCSVLAVAMSRVVTRRRIVLTGTPMQNNLREYYCMVNFVKPNLLGTYSEYSNRFENPIMNGQHRDSIDQDIKLMKARTHILHKVLEGCLQRQEASVLYPYLPKKHEYTVFIPLTKCQWDLYKHYLNVYANQSKQSVLKDFHILQKIWSHPQVLHFFQTKKRVETRNKLKVEKLEDDLAQEDLGSEDIKPSDTEWWLPYLEGGKMLDMLKSSNKFVAVFRILDECIKLGDKVLIFSTSLFCLDALESFLKKINKWSLGQEYYRLDGSVPAEVRQKWCREFNADHNHKTKLFLISTRAGCLGLNMTAANRVIILDTSWNPAHDIQSIFRVYRFGQKKDCFIYRLVALGTMEQKIYERSVTKQAVACRVVDEQQIDRHYNMAELTELYRFDEEGVGVPGGVAVGVQDVALLRVARDTALHAVHEHDSLLRGSTEQSLPEHERAAAWMQFQQEHAHKQMQNDIDADKEKHLKLMHENALNVLSQQNFEVKLENQQTPASVEPIPSVSDPKTKKGRKSSVVKCFIPIKTEIEQPQPGPSNVVQDVGNEEDMVKQITHILIKHNFQSRKGPSEISSLVNSVRKVVRSGQSSQLDMSDELTASIAKVLLQREGKTMPALTDVISEPTVIAGPSIMRTDIAPRKRGRPKRFKEEHDLPIETLIVPDESSSTEMDGRKKRKAALVAVKHLDSMAKDSVIELDDDDWKDNSDTDSASQPEDNYESTKAQLAKTDKSQLPAKKDITQSMSKNYEAPQPKNCAAPNVSFIENDSILLSDDDELSFITPEKTTVVEKPSTVTKPNTVEKPITVVEKPITVEKPAIVEKPATVEKSAAVEKPHRPGPASKKLAVKHKEAEKSVSEQVTPLHRSLLTNKNFIKIVAHTYLAGNPMLDEDAATLAAKYSTLKALKEVEASGKEIDSGPIYDIAVRVLGIDILKKLHKSNIPSKSSPQEMATTQHVQDKMLECQQVKMELANRFEPVQDKPLERSQPKVGVKKIADMRPNPVKQLPPIVQPGVPDVVPVGFFKRASNISSTETIQQPTGGECILPDDDDDVRIVSDPVPGPAMPANIVPVKPITVSRRNIKQPILLTRNHTATGEVAGGVPGDNYTPVSTAVPLPSRHIEISSGRVMVPQAPIKVTAGPRSQPPPSVAERTNDSTICLDSDDEESIVPHATMARPPQPGPVPVPVAMTTGGVLPQVVPMSLAAASPLPPRLLNSTPSACPLPAPTNNILYLKPNQKYLLPTTVNPLNQQNVQVAQSPLNMILQRKIYDNVIPAPVAPSPAPETIVPMEAPRRLVPGKTMCKPGDILRVTKSGQIEVLTKCDDSVLPLIQSVQASEPAPAGVIEPVKPSPAQQDTSAVEAVPAQTVSDEEAQTRTPRKRIRVMSSSSSSSDSSRPSSPDDPLSILKDVVHIQAAYQPKIKPRVTTQKPEEVKAPEKPPQKKLLAAPATAKSPTTTKLSTPTTTKSSTLSNAKVTVKQNTMTVNTKEAKKPNRSTISVSQGSSKPTSTLNTTGVKNVENSNSLLKVRATQQQNTTADILNRVNRSLSSGSKTGRVDLSNQEQSSTIDLTDFIVTKQNTPMKQNTSAVMNKSTPAKCKTKVVMKPEKKSATTVVGTSKSLILDGKSITTTSKKLPSTVDLTGQKSIQITNVKMIQPGTSNKSIGDKKRLASDTSAPKKKKTEQMTLKDFNIDDIDDIIELE